MLSLLCIISLLLSTHLPSVSPSLSFDVQFTQLGYDPQEVLFHQIRPKNITQPFTVHRRTQVLPRKKRKRFVPDRCDRSRIDGVMYARPARLRDEATDEVASFKMTLCLKIRRQGEPAVAAAGTEPHGGRIGLFMYLVPYPWNASDERIEVGLDSSCAETEIDWSSSGAGSDSEAVVCAHVRYDSADELLLTTVRIGDRSCMCGRKLDRSRVPKEVAIGFASTTAGDPIELGDILTWAFHSTLESNKENPLIMTKPQETTGENEGSGSWAGTVDPWNGNAELNLRYQRSWERNWQLTCSLSISVGYGNANNNDMH